MRPIDALYKSQITNDVFFGYGFSNAKKEGDSNRMFKFYTYIFSCIVPFTYFSKKYNVNKAIELCFSDDEGGETEQKEIKTQTEDTKEKFHNACIENKLVELLDFEVELYEQYKQVLNQFTSIKDIDEYIEWYKKNKSLFRNVY